MRIKEGIGWKAGYNEEKNIYGAETIDQGSWNCYEISAAVFSALNPGMEPREAAERIETGRHLYMHVNDRNGPPYNVVLDEDYRDYCPWMGGAKQEKTWSAEMTDAAVELLESEKDNREQRKNKRKKRNRIK